MLQIETTQIEQLYADLCERNRREIGQSHAGIVHQAQQRLRQYTDDQAAVNLVAVSSLQRNRPEQALRLLDQHSSTWRDDAVSRQIAGYAYWALEDLEQAHEHLDRAVRIDPHHPECWILLGKLCENSGADDQAVEHYQRAIVLDDAAFESAIALSKLHAKKRRVRDAIHILRVSLLRNQRASPLNLALAKLLQRRAGVLKRQGKHIRRERLLQEALDCYVRANAAAPTVRSLIAQGRLQQRLGHYEAAKETFTDAVKRDPNSAIALTMLAVAHVDCGDLPKALTLFRSSLQIEPRNAFTHFRFSRAQKFQRGSDADQYIASLQKILSQPEWKKRDRVLLNFSIAKAFEDTGRYDEAWTHYDRANRLKRGHTEQRGRNVTVQPEESMKKSGNRIAKTLREFSPQLFQDLAAVEVPAKCRFLSSECRVQGRRSPNKS